MSLFTELSKLSVGDVVPTATYIADYGDGTRPRWTVVSRLDRSAGIIALLLMDPGNVDLDLLAGPGSAATGVLTCPSWTRRGPIRRLEGMNAGDPTTWGMNPMCSLDQQARRWIARKREMGSP